MLTKRMSVVLSLGAVLMAGCTGPEAGSGADVTVFEGARLIVGDGSAPIEDAVFVVEGDRFTQAGRRADVEVPGGATRVDLSGKDRHAGPREHPRAPGVYA